MSADRSSQESGCSTMGSPSPDGTTPGSASQTNGGEASCESAGPEFRSTPMSDDLPLLPTPNAADGTGGKISREETVRSGRRASGQKAQISLREAVTYPPPSPSSREASPARASAPQASERASAIPKLSFGASSSESSGLFDPDTYSSRTLRLSSPSTEESASEKSWPAWPKAGSTAGGIVYERQTLAPRTAASGSSSSGLLPTPAAQDGKNATAPSQHDRKSPPITHVLLPTPNASLSNYGDDPEDWEKRRQEAAERHGNNGLGKPLPIALKTASTSASTPKQSTDGKDSLEEKPRLRLSSEFTGWMLGLPQGWSDPDCLATAMEFRCSSGSFWGE